MTIHIRRKKRDENVMFQTPTVNAPTPQGGVPTPLGLASPASVSAGVVGDDSAKRPWRSGELLFLYFLFHSVSRLV